MAMAMAVARDSTHHHHLRIAPPTGNNALASPDWARPLQYSSLLFSSLLYSTLLPGGNVLGPRLTYSTVQYIYTPPFLNTLPYPTLPYHTLPYHTLHCTYLLTYLLTCSPCLHLTLTSGGCILQSALATGRQAGRLHCYLFRSAPEPPSVLCYAILGEGQNRLRTLFKLEDFFLFLFLFCLEG